MVVTAGVSRPTAMLPAVAFSLVAGRHIIAGLTAGSVMG
jgi:ABC-type glycerol-3-phosphate transport system permease component